MKSLKLASAAAALVLSTSANSTIISYGGYTHDTDTDIVTGNGLEWLQWDRTTGYSSVSIQSGLDIIEGGGWSIASNTQMSQLFNAFDFGLTFDNDENTSQGLNTGASIGEPGTEADEVFISMFGDTSDPAIYSSCYYGDCYQRSIAFFGTDPDGDHRYNLAIVSDDYALVDGSVEHGKVYLNADLYETDMYGYSIAIALVRDVSTVPVPAAVWLFGSGLIGLVGVARRKVRD